MMNSLQKTLALLLLVIATTALAAEDNNAEKIIIGGSSLGIRDNSKQDTEITFNVAFSDLLKVHGANISVLVFDSTQDLYTAFDREQIHGIFGTPLEIIERENKMKPEMMAIHYKNSALKQPLLALVRSTDHIKSIKDLRGKRLSMRKEQDIEKLFLNTLLLENQAPELESFFGEHINPKNISMGIMDVFFGRSDITIVRESEYKTAIELNPQLAKKLTILAESEPMLGLVAGAKISMSNKAHQVAKQSLIDLSYTEKGKQLMHIIHAEAFEEVGSKDLDSVRELLKRYKMLKANASPRPSKEAKFKNSSKASQ